MEGKVAEYKAFCDAKLQELKELYVLNEKNNWKSSEEKDGVKIHSKLHEPSGLYYIRAETTIKAPAQKVSELIQDATKTCEWDKTLEVAKIVEQVDKYTFTYTLSKKPALVVDKRDCVVLSGLYEENGQIIFAGASHEHESYPPKDSPVRCQIILWGYILTPDEKDPNVCNIVYVVLIDPKGWLPKTVTNSVSQDQAMNVREIRNFIEGKKQEKKGWF